MIDLWSGTPLDSQHRMFIDRADRSMRFRDMWDADLFDESIVEALLPLNFDIMDGRS